MDVEKPTCLRKSSLVFRLFLVGLAAALLVGFLPINRNSSEAAVPTAAVSSEVHSVIPLGKAVGIKLFSDGVLVVGLSEISTDSGSVSPAKTSGIQEGDIITHINQEKVDTIEEVKDTLQSIGGKQMSVQVLRDNTPTQLTAQAVQCSTDGVYKLGAWIRDSMAGIGTVTFYEPSTGLFGALGHGISDVDTAMLMPLQSGSIMQASVIAVKKGSAGDPGELRGSFQAETDLGELFANTSGGVFGTMTGLEYSEDELVPVATPEEVTTGPAVIRANISGDTVEEYSVEIVKLFDSDDTRDLMLEVTDPRLLSATGGIVQGMSGSPILQNGKLVGAVTHVLVNDPTRGYGVFADTMLNLAESGASRVNAGVC